MCPICNKEIESVEHSLFFCDWVRPVWLGSQIQIIPRREEVTSFHGWFISKLKLFQQNPATQDFAAISLCSNLWQIWKQRNKAFFDKKNPCPNATILQANSSISEILHSIEDQQTEQESHIFSPPFIQNGDPPD